MKKFSIFFLVLIASTVLVFANGVQEQETKTSVASSAKKAEQVVFKIANGAEPESLDPSQIQGIPEDRIFKALFEGLVVPDPETANAVPGVAESWIISDDGLQYTFKLRDCSWSDGTPITAEDVVYSWTRILDPATGSPFAWFPIMFLKGATEFNSGAADASVLGIRALDDKTFQMDLIGPLPYVLGALTNFSFAIVPKHIIEKYGSDWILPENFVGNGPFVLKTWLPQQYIQVVKNPEYWDKDNVNLDEVYYYASEDNNTMYNMYLKGEMDWLNTVPQDQIASAKLRADYQVAPQLSSYYYVFNLNKAPLDNILVRKALSRAIDKEALVEQITGAGEIPAWGIVPDMAGYDSLEFPEDNNVEAAQKLLAEAGYPNGANFPPVSVLYNTSESHKSIVSFIQQEWKKNLNIDVEIVNEEWASYLSDTDAGKFQIARYGWSGTYQDPNTFLDMFLTGTVMNGGQYSSEKYDDAINKAARMLSGDERMSVLKDAENLLVNKDQAILPLYYYVSLNMVDTDVWGGWYTNTMNQHPLKNIYKK